jgi:hypothetical protein
MPILKSAPLPSPRPNPPGRIPDGYRGEAWLPTGKKIYWTGRVAIGLRHGIPERLQTSDSEVWLQHLLCSPTGVAS